MASDTITGFFNSYLPGKINDDLIESVNAVFRFEIADAGTWTLDLKSPELEKRVFDGGDGEADCVLTTDAASWEKVLGNPSSAMGLFMMGKIKASNIGQATKLQKILS